MKTMTFLLICLLLLPCMEAAAEEPMWDDDKVGHLLISAAVGGSVYAALTLWGDDSRASRLLLASGLALLPGLAKEIYDAGQPKNHFSSADMLWNLVGALAGAGLGLGVDLIVERLRAPPAVNLRLNIAGPGASVSGRF